MTASPSPAANNWYFVVSVLGGLAAGVTVVPLNPLAAGPEFQSELETISPKGLVVGPRAARTVANVSLRSVEVVMSPAGTGLPGTIELDSLLDGEPVDPVEVDEDHVAVMLFTSGTAGAPRAAMLTHGNLAANHAQIGELAGGPPLLSSDVVLGVLPMHHIYGLNVVLLLSLSCGASIVLVEKFDPHTAAESVRRHGVTAIAGAPPMWTAWSQLDDIPPDAFASVRLARSGAAALPRSTYDAMRDRYGVEVLEGYGLTETAPALTGHNGVSQPGSVGVPLPGVELRVVDVDGLDALPGDSGEVWVRGPNVFAGYWRDDEATSRVLDPKGWLRTGDIATRDDSGALYLVDRAKDLIIVSGFNVFPAEVEDVLLAHPAVAQALVVGRSHPATGESVVAHVVLIPGIPAEEDDIIEHCADHLARYKCPTKVFIRSVLPVGAQGKPLRRLLV